MPDYRETTVQGRTWNRFHRIIAENPADGVPSVAVCEQQLLSMGDGAPALMVRDLGVTLRTTMTDPTTAFDRYDPISGEIVQAGAHTYDEVYRLLYSLVMSLAAERDAAGAPTI